MQKIYVFGLSVIPNKKCTFAAAMTSVENLRIDLKSVAASGIPQDFCLDSAFFQALDQEEISGGKVEVRLAVREGAADIFSLVFSITGKVVVQCDRCLDDLELSVETQETVKVGYADKNDEACDGDTKWIPYSEHIYDVAWDIYECIALSLPLQRVHSERGCNEEMLGKLANYSS